MIAVGLARQLRAAGVRWQPAPGDRFVVDRDPDADVFTLSDMTIEVHRFVDGDVIGFNGTVEWALDSVDLERALWLPAEHQLRQLLGATFRSLEAVPDGWRVTIEVLGRPYEATAADAEDAYGRALLELVQLAAT